MRTLEQITADEILDAIATFGVHGAPLSYELLMRILNDPNDQHEIQARYLAGELLREARKSFRSKPKLSENTYTSLSDRLIRLKEVEWARRLDGKSVGEIEELLRGKR